MTKDPVCGMTVEEKSPHSSLYAGKTYVFCSPGCKTKFDEDPTLYVAAK